MSDSRGSSCHEESIIQFYLLKPTRLLIFSGFSLNGELLVDAVAGDAAFSEIAGEEFVPALTLATGQKCRLNFGHNVDTLRYFTTCGLQEGYEPFCV